MDIFLSVRIGQVTKVSGMIFQVQIQNVDARTRTARPHSCVKVFILKKFQGGQNIQNFVKIGKKHHFTLKKLHKNNIYNLILKNNFFGPPKKPVFGFKRKTPKN